MLWARVEMELLPTGTVNAWVYGHRETRFKGSDDSFTVPAGRTPAFKAEGETGNVYLAGLYVGRAEVATTYYDGLARRIQTRARSDASDIVTQTKYNRVNKPERLLGPAHRKPSYAYSDLTYAVAKVTHHYAYDHQGRVSVWRVNIEDLTGDKMIEYAHDLTGRVTCLISSTAPLGDMTSRNQPDAGVTKYSYDSRHNVRFSQNAQQAAGGKVSYFTYDPLGRMIRSGEVAQVFTSLDANASYAFETDAASWTSRYVYDIDDIHDAGESVASVESGAAASWPVGRPTRIEQNTDADAAAEVQALIAYDHEGRVTHRRVTIDTLPARDIFYSYDLSGKVPAMVYPDGSEVRYAYDAAGRLAGVTDAEGNALAAYAYDHDGRMTTLAVGGALATGAYGYNVRDWVSGISYPGNFTMSQAYDAVGNVTSQSYRRAAAEALKAASYTYDGLYRLKTFNLDATHARNYAYDANGNVTHVVTDGVAATYAYSRGSTPNRLDSLTVAGSTDTFVYNANGSATQVAGAAMAYDHRGLVTGHGAYAYTLDAEGYRVKKTGGGSTVYYIRGAGGSVLATYDDAGNLTATYLYAGGDRLAKVAGGVVSYYLKDHLGSTRTLLSSGGTAEATYDYWPYGEVLATGGTGATPFKFTGHERDTESGLDFMPFRTYRSESLRFLQVDPAAEKYPSLSPYNCPRKLDHLLRWIYIGITPQHVEGRFHVEKASSIQRPVQVSGGA